MENTAPDEPKAARTAWWRPRRSWWSIAGCVAVVAALAAPIVVYCPGGPGACQFGLTHVGATGDWRYFAELWETTRITIMDFGQFPSWNPYHCGGIVLYQDPQAPFPGLLFLLTFFWLPTAVGIKLWIIVHLLVGALGARLLVADRGGNGAEQVLAATITTACAFVAHHMGGGHLSFTAFLYLPLMLWAFRRALKDVRYIALVAALLALADIQGATYPVPLMTVALMLETVARLGSADDRRGLLWALPVLGVLFVLIAGVRLVPVLHYLREHPRLLPLDDQSTLGEIFKFWTTRMHPRAHPGHTYVWDEYGDYVGVVPVVLMLAGVALAIFARDPARRERRIDLVLLVGLVWCAMGNIPGPSLFGLLHELPIYASLRVPSRFVGPAMTAFALLAVGALVKARAVIAARGPRPRLARALPIIEIVLVVGVAADVTLTNLRLMQQGIDPVLSRSRASADFFQNTAADYGQLPTFPVQGFGTRHCYVPLEWKPAPGIVDGKVPQAWMHPAEAGAVKPVRWSPNVIEIEATVNAGGVLVVNQNYETGWKANAGTVGAFVAPEGRFWDIRSAPREALPAKGGIGLLGVKLPPGVHKITLRHRPPGLWTGLLFTLAGVALAIGFVRWAKPARLAELRARLRRRLWSSDDPPA